MSSISPLQPTSPLYPNNTDIIDDNFENLNNWKQELALTSLVWVNLNTIITNWKYCASATCTNIPESWVKTRLIVNVDPTNSNLAMQEALTTTTLISYVRTTANGGSTWTAWTMIWWSGWSSAIKRILTVWWTIWATGTNVWPNLVIDWTYTISQVNMWYWTAWNWTLTVDINKNGTTLFATTKPSITSTNKYSINTWTLTTTSLASWDSITIDIDAVPWTPWVDLYIEIIYS